MKSVIAKAYQDQSETLSGFINSFDRKGKRFGNQDRNTLKLFQLEGETVNIKSFKVPHLINKIAYRFFRKSKAQRSYEYANILLEKGIKTPQPIAYFQESGGLFFGKSYYISKHLNYDFTYRELINDEKFPNRYEILIEFTRFTFQLHENGIEFLDHSPGNTLIIANGVKDYDFYLVDLNRMKFHTEMDYATRIKNFARLTPEKNMVLTMAGEYAKLIHEDFGKVFEDMWNATQQFFEKFNRKKRFKQKLGV